MDKSNNQEPEYGYQNGYGAGAPQNAPADSTPPPTYGYQNGYGSSQNNQSSDQPGASVFSNALNQAKVGVGQVASQPDLQPFKGVNPFSKPQGGPVDQVLGSMRQVANLPLRFSQTLGAASQPVSEWTAGKLGEAGVNPYVSAGAGMLAGAAVDPRSWVPISGEIPKSAGSAELPVMQPGATTGEPHALFAYNDNFGPDGAERSLYNVFGDKEHPVIKQTGHGSSITKADLDKAGIPVVGRQPNSLKYQPLDELSAPSAPDQGFLAQRGGVSLEHSNELPLKVAQGREARTGVPARQYQALYKDPGAIFAGGKIDEAGANIGKAKAAAGIDPGVTSDLSSLTPENIDRINPTKAAKMDDINSVLGKITNNQLPSPQEAQNALDSVNSIMSQPSVQNNRDVFRQWAAVKSHINESLQNVAPDVRAANQGYAKQKLGEAFSPMNAVNKSGTPSKLGMMATKLPGVVGGAVGSMVHGLPPGMGAIGGYKAGQFLDQLYHSPFAGGVQTAAGSVANRAVDPLLEALEKMGTSAPAQALVARYLEQRKNQ